MELSLIDILLERSKFVQVFICALVVFIMGPCLKWKVRFVKRKHKARSHTERSNTFRNTHGQKIRDMKTWLTLFCKHVGDKVPVENMTVVPYRQIKTIWEEYVDDINGSGGLYGTPAGISHFRAVWNRWSVKHNVRLLQETGSFVNCTICISISA